MATQGATTQDAFLGGKVVLRQPALGYRAGQDPVLLAAAVAIAPGQTFADLGCGAGPISLCLMARLRGHRLQAIALEQDPDLAALAAQNAQENRIDQLTLHQADLFSQPPQPVDWALSNPPFFGQRTGRLPAQAQRQAGRHATQSLSTWVKAVAAWVRPRGRLGLILHSAQIPEAMAALHPAFGGITLLPLMGREGQASCERCLCLARQGSRSPFQLASPLTLRQADGSLSAAAQAILHEGAALPLPPIR